MKKITEHVYATDDEKYLSARILEGGYIIVAKQTSKYDAATVAARFQTLEEAKDWIIKYETETLSILWK
jgi:hypothetical protein